MLGTASTGEREGSLVRLSGVYGLGLVVPVVGSAHRASVADVFERTKF